jgi:hypothetical protein
VRVHNFLKQLIDCLKRWERVPTLADFTENYYSPMGYLIEDVFDSALSMHEVVAALDWKAYREQALGLDPGREEARVRRHLEDVERLFGFPLEGEIVLFGAFETMDGYARFEQGSHRVYLGVDESHGRGQYLDILEVHELTHVARESRPSVWTGWGLNPKMTHDEFVESQPVIEHLFGEGFSCTISELLVPCDEPWHYAYQEPRDYEKILRHAKAADATIHRELRREIQSRSGGDWSRLYQSGEYSPPLPVFAHYLWGWQWTRKMLRERAGGDPMKLIQTCSQEFVEDALNFSLEKLRTNG